MEVVKEHADPPRARTNVRTRIAENVAPILAIAGAAVVAASVPVLLKGSLAQLPMAIATAIFAAFSVAGFIKILKLRWRVQGLLRVSTPRHKLVNAYISALNHSPLKPSSRGER